jgi:glycosyltransferase involved in cell wall biosynthesis
VDRILVVEPEAEGHHFVPYVSALVAALSAAGIRTELLTTRSALEHPALCAVHSASGGAIGLRLMPGIRAVKAGSIVDLLRAQLSGWRAIRSGVTTLDSTNRPDLCILMGLDAVDRAISIFGNPCFGIPFVGLTIHTKFHWPEYGIGPGGRHAAINRWTFDRVLAQRGCLGIASIDGTLVEHESRRGRNPGMVRFVPDPGEVPRHLTPREARLALGVDPRSGPLVLVYGGLDARKNILALLRAARVARCMPVVALAGRLSPHAQALWSGDDWRALEHSARLVVEDGFLPPDRESLWYCAADVVWVGYRADFFGQSAVIPQAASVGVPVLGRSGGLIGRTVDAHGLGETVDPENTEAVALAIDRLVAKHRAGDFNERLRHFSVGRSHAAYGKAWTDALSAWWRPSRDR